MDKRMPQDSLSFLQRLEEYGIHGYAWMVFLASWGGVVRYLTTLKGNKPTFAGIATELFVSGFVGVIVGMTCQYYQLDFLLASAITGICGHNGTRSLYLISNLIQKKTPIPIFEVNNPAGTYSCKGENKP